MAQVQCELVQADIASVLHRLQYDPEFFIQFFLRDELTHPVPGFHKEVFGDMVSVANDRAAFAIPRDHAKTTLAKLAAVHYFLFTHFRFILYLSATSTMSVESCKDVVAFLESDNFVAVFGPPRWLTRQEGTGLYKFELTLYDENFNRYTKTCILRAFGAQQQVRGVNVDNKRPQLAIVDDLESDENTATPQLQRKLKKWVYGPFFKCLDKFGHKIIWLGNMISNTCMLKEFTEDPEWTSWRFGALLSNGQPLWPDAWPLAKLLKDFITYQRAGMLAVWFAEMMNLPLPDGLGLIKSDEIKFGEAVAPNEIQFAFLTIDPAISKKAHANNTALAVHGLVDQKWQIVDYISTKLDPLQTIKAAISLAFKWGVRVIGVESVAYQASLRYFFEYYFLVNRIEGFEIAELTASGRKVERIMAWAAMLKADEYRLSAGDMAVAQQLITYDPSKEDNDDDLIDACAYGPQMIARYLGLIMSYVVKLPTPEVKYGTQVCAI